MSSRSSFGFSVVVSEDVEELEEDVDEEVELELLGFFVGFGGSMALSTISWISS